jgi:hypothetical protein
MAGHFLDLVIRTKRVARYWLCVRLPQVALHLQTVIHGGLGHTHLPNNLDNQEPRAAFSELTRWFHTSIASRGLAFASVRHPHSEQSTVVRAVSF